MFVSDERDIKPSSMMLSVPSKYRTSFYYLLLVGLAFGSMQAGQFFDGGIPTVSLHIIHLVVMSCLFITALVLLWFNQFNKTFEKVLFYVLVIDYCILNHFALHMGVHTIDGLFTELLREDIWLLGVLCASIGGIYTNSRWKICLSFVVFAYSVLSIIVWGISHNVISDMSSTWQLYTGAGFLIVCTCMLSHHRSSLLNSKVELRQLQLLANTDYLTNIANRRHIEEILQLECERSNRYKSALAVVLWDIDSFKKVNDEYGHTVGDEVLKIATEHIASQLREMDILGRWGGEEFLCVLPQTELEQAVLLAERLRSSLANLNQHDTPQITASFGIAAISTIEPLNNTTTELKKCLIQKADQELYKAKALGRNKVSPLPLS